MTTRKEDLVDAQNSNVRDKEKKKGKTEERERRRVIKERGEKKKMVGVEEK